MTIRVLLAFMVTCLASTARANLCSINIRGISLLMQSLSLSEAATVGISSTSETTKESHSVLDADPRGKIKIDDVVEKALGQVWQDLLTNPQYTRAFTTLWARLSAHFITQQVALDTEQKAQLYAHLLRKIMERTNGVWQGKPEGTLKDGKNSFGTYIMTGNTHFGFVTPNYLATGGLSSIGQSDGYKNVLSAIQNPEVTAALKKIPEFANFKFMPGWHFEKQILFRLFAPDKVYRDLNQIEPAAFANLKSENDFLDLIGRHAVDATPEQVAEFWKFSLHKYVSQ